MKMKYTKAHQWIKERKIKLDESFCSEFRRLADEYIASHPDMTLSQIYRVLGISKQSLYWWETHSNSVQSKNNYKQNLIVAAAEMFGLDDVQAEHLANRAGLSLATSDCFNVDFREAVLSFDGDIRRLYKSAMISERMMEYFMSSGENRRPSKPCVTAVAIALKKTECEIQSFHRQVRISPFTFDSS